MLSAKQKAMRRTGITASETAAVLREHPYRSATHVWLSKPTPSRPALLDVEDDDRIEDENARQQVGTFLEAGIRELVRARTGIHFRRSTTLRHKEIPHVLATPDGLSSKDEDAGLEIKMVGARMAHHWADHTVPDYTATQARVGMAVARRSRWIVAALIGGTDLRIHVLERDFDLEEATNEAVGQFWLDNVLGDEPPEPESVEERKLWLRTRYPGAESTACERVDAEEVAECMRWYASVDGVYQLAKAKREELSVMLAERVGAAYGIETSAGKFLHYNVRGRIDWQAVAEEIAGDRIPEDVIERHRGAGSRVPRFYPPKTPSTNGRKRLRP